VRPRGDLKQVALTFSLVLPFSLTQTRQRHLTHLLPHIFSHPPIPSHSRPRARPVPKGTFLFPTPAPPEPPLPLKEYHAPARPLPSATSAPTNSQSPGSATAEMPEQPGQSRPPKPKAKAKERSIAPAHEIECIARVTLSIGPISYPGTEIWMGRFVNPRVDQPNGPRKREKGDTPSGAVPKKRKHEGGAPATVKEKKKHLPAIAGMAVKPGPPAPGIRPPRPPVAGPSRPSGPPPGAPAPRPPAAGTGVGRPPGAPRARPPIVRPCWLGMPQKANEQEPDLIQRVNQAATQHPWLSVIIHKAARNTASKEELAKLGRIVARLGKGEGVGEGPLDGLPQTPRTPATSVTSVATPRPPVPTNSKADSKPAVGASGSAMVPVSTTASTAQAASSKTATAPAETKQPAATTEPPVDDDSSDDDFDMTGEPQTGGGPIDPELLPDVARSNTSAPSASTSLSAPSVSVTSAAGAVASVSTSQSGPPVPTTPGSQGQLSAPPAPSPSETKLEPATTATPSIAARLPTNASPGGLPDRGHPDIPTKPAALSNVPPPPPNRIYPLPPPFLLIAFKETPTEKFLLPLGSQSYVSRIGSPVVAKTTAPPEVTASLVAQTSLPGPAVLGDEATPQSVPARGRTRQSLGRGASTPQGIKKEGLKDVDAAEAVAAEEICPALPRQPARSGLPLLPGISPPKGTVLLSTIIPVDDWLKPDWEKLAQRMPFYSKAYDEVLVPSISGPDAPVASHAEATEAQPSKPPKSPKTRIRVPPSPRSHRRGDTAAQVPSERNIDPNTLLNMGAESFMPPEGNVRAVTIRLEGVDDAAWNKMRWVMDHIDGVEMKALGVARPDLLETSVTGPATAETAAPAAANAANAANVAPAGTPTRPPIPKPFDPSLHPRLRKAYDEYRQHRIERLLQRVPSRTFPKFRLPGPRTDIKDAMADRWAPRKYPMSTRPLYLTSPPPEGAEYEEEEVVPQPKRKRGQAEEEVMFEMPVSLDMLDERVEAGAKKSVNRRVGKLKLGKNKPQGEGRVKNVGKRSKPGMVCEGCARTDQKVWRKGPGGKGTCE